MNNNLNIPKDKIVEFCRRHHIQRLGIFGSALREDFKPDINIDVLVDFDAGHSISMFEIIDIEQKLSELLGRKVDLVERRAVEKSENYIRRRHILQSVETIYVA